MKIEDGMERFINEIENTKNLSEKTIKAYRSDLRAFCSYVGSDIENNGVLEYVEYLRNMSDLKDSSIKRKIVSIKMFCTYLFDIGYIDKEPFKRFRFTFKQERKLPKTLSLKEMNMLLSAVHKSRYSATTAFSIFEEVRNLAILELLTTTGIRIGELSLLSMNDIFYQSHTLLIHGKGRRQRIVYISCQEAWNSLKDWVKVRKSVETDCNNVFLNRYGRQMSIHSIEAVFKKYRDRSGINPKSTPHYLRHTFATNLLANGADIRSVQEILGHQSISTTEIYTEVSDKRKRQVLSKYNYRNKLKIPSMGCSDDCEE